jgi:EAL domain-containing protein (putative c-di-GMP-specific phosphodiesterase class I)
VWQKSFPSDPPLSVGINITPKQFTYPGLAGEIKAAFQKTGIDPASVDLEITETIAMADATSSASIFGELKALGTHLSIDDFGTGYSSLSRLQSFPVDTLKIDRAFISRMEIDAETHEIVRTVVALAHNLGLNVVAEGVETEQQVELLKHIGCEMAQGYLFSKPVRPEVIEQLLRNQKNTALAATVPTNPSPLQTGTKLSRTFTVQ